MKKKKKMNERNNNKEGLYNSPINLISFPFLSNFPSLSLFSRSFIAVSESEFYQCPFR